MENQSGRTSKTESLNGSQNGSPMGNETDNVQEMSHLNTLLGQMAADELGSTQPPKKWSFEYLILQVEQYLALTMVILLILSVMVFAAGISVSVTLGRILDWFFLPEENGLVVRKLLMEENKKYMIPVHTRTLFTGKEADRLDLGQFARDVGNYLISGAIIMAVYCLVGVFASINRNKRFMVPLIIMLVVCIVYHCVITVAILATTSWVHKAGKVQMREILDTRYNVQSGDLADELTTTPPFSAVFNSIMMGGECCGVLGHSDFKGRNFSMEMPITDIENTSQTVTFNYPPACVTRDCINGGVDKIVQCAQGGLKGINTRGCYDVLYDYVFDTFGADLISLMFFVILIEICAVILTCAMLYRELYLVHEEEYLDDFPKTISKFDSKS